jgi:DNA uptake protein ComE-like DNA-binding protein
VPRLALVVALAAIVGPACSLVRHDRSPPAPVAVDLNHASRRTLEKLPGVTPSMARQIIDGRPYDDPHDLVARGILTERELARLGDRVVVTPRGP